MRVVSVLVVLVVCLLGCVDAAKKSETGVFLAKFAETFETDLDNIKVVKFRDTGRGMAAARPVAEGDVLFSVPLEAVVS
ncbi:hypothetical protein KIPB_013599, partial [Kipferlia bialata]|eukprot:g13599.t1